MEKTCTLSRNRSWKACIGIALDEALLALEESFHDLSDEQLWRQPLPQRHSPGSMVMHCLQNLNQNLCERQTGKAAIAANWRAFDVWDAGPEELDRRQEGQSLPPAERMGQWLKRIREAAFAGLESASEQDLLGPRAAAEWCREHGRTAGDAYLRTICHTHAHVRQIWCLRGVIGAFGAEHWPHQWYA